MSELNAEETDKHKMELIIVPISEIHADDEFNCREKIIPMDVIELAKDIKQNGLHQPIAVALYDDVKQTETRYSYRLLAGFRRFAAFKVNGEIEIPCILKKIKSEVDALAINLSENLQREDLNILQEAKAIKRMRDLGLTEIEAGDRIGKSRGWVQVRFMLLGLPNLIDDEAAIGAISLTQIRELYTIFRRSGDVKIVLEAAREMKEAKARGKSFKSKQDKHKTRNQKRHRNRTEIFNMLEEVLDAVGSGLHTRTLAWAAGQISNHDLYMDIKEFAKEKEIIWNIPE
jgi:ParB family chromosome partitioning protein